MPIVTMASRRRASATAFFTTLRNSFGFATIWSLEKKPTTGSLRVELGSFRVRLASLRVELGSFRVRLASLRVGLGAFRDLEKLDDPKPTLYDSKPTLDDAIAKPTPSATAAPVSRRIGSPTMLPFGTSGSSFRVATTSFFVVTTNASSGATSPSSLASACLIRLSPPNTRRNCFGRSGVESGQNRSPDPPARITALNPEDAVFILTP